MILIGLEKSEIQDKINKNRSKLLYKKSKNQIFYHTQ